MSGHFMLVCSPACNGTVVDGPWENNTVYTRKSQMLTLKTSPGVTSSMITIRIDLLISSAHCCIYMMCYIMQGATLAFCTKPVGIESLVDPRPLELVVHRKVFRLLQAAGGELAVHTRY